MEFDLASINKELSQSIPAKSAGTNKTDDAALPPSSRLRTIEEMIQHSGSPKISDLTKEISDLKVKHAEEIAQWKDYENRIQAWKQQVQDIFTNLKNELLNKHELAAELVKVKTSLQAKQKELEMLRFYIENKEGKDVLDKITKM
jgi:predicted  nucleic acid-binding Zn-ribbon protein